MHDLWRCPRCTLEKDPTEFYADRPGLAGALFWCKPCVTSFLMARRRKRKAEAPEVPEERKAAA